jgi:hypothetical protein
MASIETGDHREQSGFDSLRAEDASGRIDPTPA